MFGTPELRGHQNKDLKHLSSLTCSGHCPKGRACGVSGGGYRVPGPAGWFVSAAVVCGGDLSSHYSEEENLANEKRLGE